jgi:mannose-6-phosphate isomerase-like protein (cupin superfamily)
MSPDERQPVVVDLADRAWETWPTDEVPERGPSSWKTLISAGTTPSEDLTLGVACLPPGETLPSHRHEQAEVYLVLGGAGVVTVDGARRPLRPGIAVFVPGGAVHSVESTGPDPLRVAYVLAADSFEDVTYVFED